MTETKCRACGWEVSAHDAVGLANCQRRMAHKKIRAGDHVEFGRAWGVSIPVPAADVIAELRSTSK